MSKYFASLFLLMSINLHGQMKDVTGEYYLTGVMETASGFRFNADSTFDFFFSQGALDREGSGVWKRNGNQLVLNGPPRHEKDFILEKSRHTKEKQVTVQIEDPNKMLLRYVLVGLKDDTAYIQQQADESGMVKFPLQPITEISLIHLIFPDRYSDFVIADSAMNEFTFRIDPAIAKVYFDNIILNIGEDGLTGGHPLLKGNEFSYEKN
jgi:hypothetical protein